MKSILEMFCDVEDEFKDTFQLGRAIFMILLIITFLSSSLYVLFNSMA
jgi:heme/copper-type cytochrome/quinol oxidase subunit 4